MGPNPISITDMVSYWRDIGNIGRLDEFIAVIQSLDSVYLANHAEKQKAKKGT